MMCVYRPRLLVLSFCFSWIFAGVAVGETPLHEKIDAVLAKTEIGPSAPPAGDAEFLRRISLDLTGRIPSAERARKFLAEKSPDKRRQLIEELFEDPALDRHLAKVFDIMFMERRPDKHVKGAEWDAYLLKSMQQNKPYNILAREILAADGVDPEKRAAVKFYLDRDDLSLNLVTRDIGRVFFGRDIECAQCHDHPLIADYWQSEYYGLYAFISRSSLFQPADKKKPAVIGETAEGMVTFKSVFTGYEGETRPRLPGGKEITEPTFKKGEEYVVKPAKNVRPVPKYSRREQLAKLATAGTNEAFNKNIANRLWRVMMGRGQVDPVDLHHSENPPASPELLELLTREFVAMNFDVKKFLKEIALSKTYQRSFRLPDSFAENIKLAKARIPELEAQREKSRKQADGLLETANKLDADLTRRQKELEPLAAKLKAAETERTKAEKTHQTAQAALKKLQESLAAKHVVAKLLAEASAKADLAAKNLPGDKPLAEAGTVLSVQAKTWADQIAALRKQVDQLSAAAQAAEAKLAEAQKLSEQIRTEQAQIKAAIQKIETDIQTARHQRDAALKFAAAAGRERDRMKLLADYDTASKQLQAARAELKSFETELAAAQAETVQLAEAVQQRQDQLADIAAAQSEAEETLAQKKSLLATHSEASRLLADALTQLEAAQKQLPGDKPLAEVAKELESAREHQKEQQSAVDKAVAELEASAKDAAGDLTAMEKSIAEAEADLKESQSSLAELKSKHKTAREELARRDGAFQEAGTALAEDWTKHFRVASMEQLSPEQLGWSVLQAVGQVGQQRSAALAAWNKKHPDLAGKELAPEQQAERDEFIEQTIRTKLAGSVAKFLPLFAANSGQPQHEFFATVEQALYLANGNDVLAWLRPAGGNLTDRLRKIEDPKTLAEELYLSILTRLPTAEEVRDVAEYLSVRKDDRDQAIQEMAWALLTSSEFRFQH